LAQVVTSPENLSGFYLRGRRVRQKLARIARAVAVVAAMASGCGLLQAAAIPHPGNAYRLSSWPHHGASPDFLLIDVDGRPRTMADYRGKVVVLMFGFVRCPDVCPTELIKLAEAMKKLGPASAHVQVLFISLDPERDTPAILKSYVEAFDPRFGGLSGTTAQTDAAAASFFVQYAKVPDGDDYVISHSSGIYLIDTVGRLRLVGTMNTTVADLVHDIAALTAEK
jgi:protein SCO1